MLWFKPKMIQSFCDRPFAACFLEVLEDVKDVSLLGKAFKGGIYPS